MAWKLEFTAKAEAQLNSLGTVESGRILKFLHERLLVRENPREIGKALQGILRGMWRYRVGDYRIICRIEHNIMTVFVVDIDHRSRVYKHQS